MHVYIVEWRRCEMKKLWILIPVIIVAALAGVAVSKADSPEKPPTYFEKRMWEGFPGRGLRLGIVMDETDRGVRVDRVVPGSPAEKAGVHENDVIVGIDGKNVNDARDVRDVVRDMDNEPREIEMQVERDGNPLTLRVMPEKRDRERMMFAFGNRMYLGVNLQELNPDLASYFQVDPNAGVLVTSVQSDTPAEKGGLRSGDVITHINGNKVSTPSDVSTQLEDIEAGTQLEVTVLRHGAEQRLTVVPEERSWEHPEIPPMPELRQMLRENPEFRDDMEGLRREMESLKHDLELRKEDLQKMREEIQEKVQKEMEQLRQELKKKNGET